MSHAFLVTRDIPCTGLSAARSESVSIPQGSTVSFIGSPAPNRVEVSWNGQSVTMLACDFAEKTEVRQLAVAARSAGH